MSVNNPAANPVSPKVKASSTAAFVVPLVLTLIAAVQSNDQLLDGLPDWVTVVVAALLPGLAAFLTGYQARDPLRVTPPV